MVLSQGLKAQPCSGSLLFDNNNPAVNLPAGNQYYSGANGGYTWECWFKLNQPFNGNVRPLINAVDGVTFEDMWLGFGWQGGWFNNPVTSLVFKVDGPNSTPPSGPNCNYAPPGGFIIGTWYHAAGVMNYTTQRAVLYLNGVAVDTRTVTVPPITRVIPGELSYNWSNTPVPLFGNMDEVRIWNRPLTATEIAANYDKCLSGSEQNLLLYYRCNQPGGANVPDATSNGLTGTFSTNAGWSSQQAPVTGTACGGPSPTVSVAAGSTTLICVGETATLTATGASSYTWSTGANTAGIVVSPAATSSYTVQSMAVTCNSTSTASAVVTVSVNPLPALSAAASPTLLCSGGSSTLTAGGAMSYTWNAIGLPSGNTNTVIVVNPTQTTLYTLTGSNGSCINSSTVSVTVISNTVVVQDMAICPGQTGTLTATGATSYAWTNAATLSSSTGSLVVASPASTQAYTVTGTTGVCTNSAVATVSVVSNPVITVSPSTTTVCPGTAALLTASGTASYTWSPVVSPVSVDGSTVSASPSVNTTYTVTGGIGTCTNTALVSISVLPSPTLATQDQTVCAGSSATLSASGAVTYTWQPGAHTGSGISVSPASTQLYTVSGTSASGCIAVASASVTVVLPPALTVSGNTATLCSGSSATLSASGASSYSWMPGGANTSGLEVSPAATTTYTVSGEDHLAGCISTGTLLLTVLPALSPTISAKEEICLGQSTKIYASGGNMYQWNPSAGIKDPADPVIAVSPSVSTIYSVTVSSYTACPVTATVEITVNPLPVVFAGNDTIVNMDEVIGLTGTGNVPVGFISSTGQPLNCTFCSAILVNPQENTCYTLMGENVYRCVAFDEVCVSVTKDWNVYIPNTFTPNGDEVNDAFLAYGYGILSVDLQIFDRWGELIFKEEDTRTGWDGKRGGVLCEQGVYTYKMRLHVMTGQQTERVGHVTLLPKK